jgi:hypothetical protein
MFSSKSTTHLLRVGTNLFSFGSSDFAAIIGYYSPGWCTTKIIEYFWSFRRTIEEVRNLVIGFENSPVTLKFFRAATNSNFEITLYRKPFRDGASSLTVSRFVLYLCMHACTSICV